MDNWNTNIAMITVSDSKKPCCAPIFESLGCIAWLQTVSPSKKVFMTIGIDIDQNRFSSEKGLCSSSFSEMLIGQIGRRVGSCPSSINLKMNLGQRWNNDNKIFQKKYQVSHVYQELHSTIHQSRLHKTTLTSIALIKENLFVDVSKDKRLK
ncbi:MAG: hypothetical protein NTX44_03750 [Ignavibacteriales bacterium]|nr:hypothetical protein [Ignavibacteriales bacterium]